jgi:hypothetical protein
VLGRLRTLVHAADPDVVEEWKWRGVPTCAHEGEKIDEKALKALIRAAVALNENNAKR